MPGSRNAAACDNFVVEAAESDHGSDLGVSDLQPNALVRSATRAASRNRRLKARGAAAVGTKRNAE